MSCVVFLLDFAFDVVQYYVDVGIGRFESFVNRLREKYGTMLSARAAERDHQVAEMALTVVVNALSDDGFHMVKEDMDGWFSHQVVDNLPVSASLALNSGSRPGLGRARQSKTKPPPLPLKSLG